MSKKTVGIFNGTVGAPYPSFCEILVDGEGSMAVSHKHLADLEHLVRWMRSEVRGVLPDSSKHEA